MEFRIIIISINPFDQVRLDFEKEGATETAMNVNFKKRKNKSYLFCNKTWLC